MEEVHGRKNQSSSALPRLRSRALEAVKRGEARLPHNILLGAVTTELARAQERLNTLLQQGQRKGVEKVNPGGSLRRSGRTSLLQYGWHGGQTGSADTVGAYCWTEQRLTDSSSWSTRFMISYRVLPICSPGALWSHLLAKKRGFVGAYS